MAKATESKGQTTGAATGTIPDLSGDIRHLVPKLGLRNYWYPAVAMKRIPKRHPIQVKLLGEEIAFFRGANGQPAAVNDICPHRGSRISEGTSHWQGTVTCPYHGWTFDETGKNISVLSEGPDSKICGKPGTEATVIPTRELKGVVFVWIGDTEPAPIEEDVPEEFFDPKAYIIHNDRIHWDTNWCQALENSLDSHVNYLHRDDVSAMLASTGLRPRATVETTRPLFLGNGFNYSMRPSGKLPAQDRYPNGWKWPKHRARRWWGWIFAPLFSLTRVDAPDPKDPDWWGTGHHLPGMYRTGGRPRRRFSFGGGGFFGRMTRQVIALEEKQARVWYFHYTRPSNFISRGLQWLVYWTIYRWVAEYGFSAQDGSVMPGQVWDHTEMLSPTDAEVIQWRRLVVTKHFGGRNAPFGTIKTGEVLPDIIPVPSETAAG
jgi:phenylpropionate dioxygenase-like ring-hydroxylating dioxygenase large terminal subunit